MAKDTFEVASYRLTNYDRDKILSRALDAGFEKEAAVLAKRETAIATRCYNAVFSAETRKKIAAVPDGWLPTLERLSFNVGGLHICFKVSELFRVPDDKRCDRLGTIKDQATIDAVNQYLADKKDHTDRYSRARTQAKAILWSVTTAKKLVEVWPESKPFLQGIGVAAEAKVPAAQITALNKMLGLQAAA